MCIAAPARILVIDGGTAVVDVAGRRRRASLLMAPDVEVGAWVLVAAGNVVRRIDAGEASHLGAQLETVMATIATPEPARSQSAPAPTRPGGSR